MYIIYEEIVPLPKDIISLFAMKTNHQENFQAPLYGVLCHEKLWRKHQEKRGTTYCDFIATEIYVI